MRNRFAQVAMDAGSRSAAAAIAILLLCQMFTGCSGLGPGNPSASISADTDSINVGETVNFDARDSTSPEPTIIDEFRWHFGDGESKTTKQGIVSHMFNHAGDYEVQVIVVNDEGSTDSASLSVFVNAPPKIVLDIPDFIRTGGTATLDASDSTDLEGGALEFLWDFDALLDSNGDSDPTNDADYNGAIADLTLTESGNHTGAITVVDDNGATATALWTLRVIPRNFKVVWEEAHVDYEWSGYLEQGGSYEIEHIPGEGARIIRVIATLTLARDLLPIQWPEDNFTLELDVPLSGWRTSIITTQENITENASATIERDGMNDNPETGYTTNAESSEELASSLLNQPGQRFGQGVWKWTITAVECDPDLPIDNVDPDEGNDWRLEVEFVVLILRISEIGV
ncbi:MAG: PKD domain-containing protein [Candidatus Thalassarchaeaceae archaeon]|nr:PKD domain-containing protein [Candidatus Thalassarchaeaceae archaeon]MDP7003810.1 PKD domain-containing protein [Candidatus Thalassarchaeaceae archaeon]